MKWIVRFFIYLILIFGLAIGAAFAIGWDKVWPVLVGEPDLRSPNFQTLSKVETSNQVLVCPPSLCNQADVDWKSPVYKVSATELHQKLLDTLKQEPNVTVYRQAEKPLQLRFIQRSEWFSFPDVIHIKLVEISQHSSTLALYSKSQIGRSDIGVNAARARRWLARLKKLEE